MYKVKIKYQVILMKDNQFFLKEIFADNEEHLKNKLEKYKDNYSVKEINKLGYFKTVNTNIKHTFSKPKLKLYEKIINKILGGNYEL